jgi:hypothetical protein
VRTIDRPEGFLLATALPSVPISWTDDPVDCKSVLAGVVCLIGAETCFPFCPTALMLAVVRVRGGRPLDLLVCMFPVILRLLSWGRLSRAPRWAPNLWKLVAENRAKFSQEKMDD